MLIPSLRLNAAAFLMIGSIFLSAQLAVAQQSAAPYANSAAQAAPAVPQSQLLAGVREYPAPVLRALLTLADSPALLRQLAENPDYLQRPESIQPAVSPELLAAIHALQEAPEAVAIAADRPRELQALRDLYRAAPEGTEGRFTELRSAYEQVALQAAGDWQRMLASNSAFVDEYRNLVTRFCEEQRQSYAAFPCVRVVKTDYYYACPPNEAIVQYITEHGPSPAFREALERWWGGNLPSKLDARAQQRGQAYLMTDAGLVTALPVAERAAMWQTVAAGQGDGNNLLPVILQPAADQPPPARVAHAVFEHGRLWSQTAAPNSAPTVAQTAPPPPVSQPPQSQQPQPQIWSVESDQQGYRYDDRPRYYDNSAYSNYIAEPYYSAGDSGYYWPGYSYAGGYYGYYNSCSTLNPCYYGYPYCSPILNNCYPAAVGCGPALSACYYGRNFGVGVRFGYAGNVCRDTSCNGVVYGGVGTPQYYPSARRQLNAYGSGYRPAYGARQLPSYGSREEVRGGNRSNVSNGGRNVYPGRSAAPANGNTPRTNRPATMQPAPAPRRSVSPGIGGRSSGGGSRSFSGQGAPVRSAPAGNGGRSGYSGSRSSGGRSAMPARSAPVSGGRRP